jgi:hypothetical protein
MYPEKVCGTEEITTSREFPITIKGDLNWIENTIGYALGDFQLILDLHGEWSIDSFEPGEDFYVKYRCQEFMIQVFAHGVGYNFQFHRADEMIENQNFQTIDKANEHARSIMEKHPTPLPSSHFLELEALALELELQMN